MLQLTEQIADRIEAFGETEWNDLASGRSLYVSHGWLAAIETMTVPRPTYIGMRDRDGRLVGATVVYLATEPRGGGYDVCDMFTSEGRQPSPTELYPIAIVGSRAGYQNQLLVHSGLSYAATQGVRSSLYCGAVRIAASANAKTACFLYLTHDDMLAIQHAGQPASILLSAADTTVRFRESDRDFDSWLARFTAKRRTTLRHERRTFLEAAYRVEHGPLSQWVAEAAGLALQTEHRYGRQSSLHEVERYFATLARHLDSRTLCVVCRAGSRAIGFALLVEWDGTLYGRAAGVDNDYGNAGFVYFNLTCYEPVELATRRGLDSLHMGTGSYDAKIVRGALIAPLWSVVVPVADNPRPQWAAFAADWNRDWRERWRARYGHVSGPLPREFAYL